MTFSVKCSATASAGCLVFLLSLPPSVWADDLAREAAVGIGVTAGNLLYVPSKAMTLVSGLAASAVSFLVTGGDVEVSRQIWQNALQGPYVITSSMARTAVGERPEPEKK